MLYQLVNWCTEKTGVKSVSAHCDIPCKIYDPSAAQIAVLSAIRFMDLIAEISAKDELSAADNSQLARLTVEKETHVEKAKHEVRIIWGDYFKAPQFEQFPDTHALVHNIMLAGSACKQGVEREKGLKLLALVNEFAASYWATKNVETFTATCPYLPSEEVVYPKVG